MKNLVFSNLFNYCLISFDNSTFSTQLVILRKVAIKNNKQISAKQLSKNIINGS